jgi:hypothetical protein
VRILLSVGLVVALVAVAGCGGDAVSKDTGKPLPPSKVFKSKDGKKSMAGDELPPPPKR